MGVDGTPSTRILLEGKAFLPLVTEYCHAFTLQNGSDSHHTQPCLFGQRSAFRDQGFPRTPDLGQRQGQGLHEEGKAEKGAAPAGEQGGSLAVEDTISHSI
eukprot:1140985-Pelagomonas_calceolata.AAC.1